LKTTNLLLPDAAGQKQKTNSGERRLKK